MSLAHSLTQTPPRVGPVTLGDLPRVVVAVRDNADRAALDAAMAAGASIVEVRIDEFARHDVAYVREQLQRLEGLPLLATIRHKREGGGWKRPEAERIALYEATLPLCDAIDCEIYARGVFPKVAEAAMAAGKAVIGSYHDFEGLPSFRRMSGIAAYGRSHGAQIIKIAAMCRRREDIDTLARFTIAQKALTPVVVIGMGESAAASRVFLPLLGSLLTYTFLGAATAPGQLTLGETLKYLSAFCPGFPGEGIPK